MSSIIRRPIVRRTTFGIMTAVALAASFGTAPASAAPPHSVPQAIQPVQYYGAAPQYRDDGWDQRRAWQERREARDEARINEAARREALAIEREREERHAWRHAQREQQWGGYGYNERRGW